MQITTIVATSMDQELDADNTDRLTASRSPWIDLKGDTEVAARFGQRVHLCKRGALGRFIRNSGRLMSFGGSLAMLVPMAHMKHCNL